MCHEKTLLTIDGQQIEIDTCIAPIIAALNTAGIRTLACCCGHGRRTGRIVLCSGVELEIHASSRKRAAHWSDLVSVREIEHIFAEA